MLFLGIWKSRFRLLTASAPISLMRCYQMPLPEAGLLDPVLYEKRFYVYRNRLTETWLLVHRVAWVIWASGAGPACAFYPVMNANCVTHFQSGNLSSPQFNVGIDLYASTNRTGKTTRREGFKYIFLLSIPCQLFWTCLLCILLVHEFCFYGLSAACAITGSGGTLFKAADHTWISHCSEHYKPTSFCWSILTVGGLR